MSFISELTDLIIRNDISDFQNIRIILPSQRAKKSLTRELSRRFDRPVFAPSIQTIEELVGSLSTLRPAGKSEMLITLYKEYKKFDFSEGKVLEDFLSWAPSFLQDINEIDMYDCDADNVFTDLSRIKDLELFGEETLSRNQKKYLEFYKHLNEIYHKFVQRLEEDGIAYNGLIYKKVAHETDFSSLHLEGKTYYFAGLSALAPIELEIVLKIAEHARVEFIFDLDRFYFNKASNEKLFNLVGEIQKKLDIKELSLMGDHYKEPKDVAVIGSGKKMTQVYLAIEALNQMTPEELDRTAVVMADESLLVPFVHAYGSDGCNITMGYPVQQTQAYQLLKTLFSAAQNLRRLQSADGGYYFRDVLSFVRNDLVRRALFPSGPSHDAFIKDIVQTGYVFIRPGEIKVDGEPIFPDLSKEGITFIDNLSSFFTLLRDKMPSAQAGDRETKEQSLIRCFIEILQHVKELFQELGEEEPGLTSILTFIDEEAKRISLSFKGEQTKGLQVMGILETRLLDFENLFILGVNEGILPAGKEGNSLLLYDVKRHYGLPTYETKDSIYAYHFFRLLQRARKVHLFYDTDTSATLAEESRFIRQLEFEVKRQQLNNIRITREMASLEPHFDHASSELQITKTDEIIEKIYAKQLSATSLQCYIKCPLCFYLQYIAKIEPQETINENVEKNTIGSVFHKVMEDLFNEIKADKARYADLIAKYQEQVEGDYLEDVFKGVAPELKNQDFSRGKLLLAVEAVRRYLTRYLDAVKRDFDSNAGYIDIIATEMKFNNVIKVGKRDFQLTGSADLVEKRGDIIFIKDYKTGKLHNLTIPDEIVEIFQDPKHKQLFQLLLYTHLYLQRESETTKPKPESIRCEIIALQELMSGKGYEFPAQKKDSGKNAPDKTFVPDKVYMDSFEEWLQKLLAEMADKENPFKQTEFREHCKYCDYLDICGRRAEVEK